MRDASTRDRPAQVTGPDGEQVEVASTRATGESSREGWRGCRCLPQSRRLAARFPQIHWRITAGNSSQITDGAAPC